MSDRGSCFTSSEFDSFIKESGVKHVKIATGAPRANGQIERLHRTLTPMLAKVSVAPNKWDECLAEVEFCFNNVVNCSTGNTPSKLLFGLAQKGHIEDSISDYVRDLRDETNNIDKLRDSASDRIVRTQEQSKVIYDNKHKKPTDYEIGDLVMIINVDTTPGVNKKLIPKYRGPYQIKTKLGNDRYVVCDVEGCQVTQIPFEGIVDVTRMRKYASADDGCDTDLLCSSD